jgi:hypothetical protein
VLDPPRPLACRLRIDNKVTKKTKSRARRQHVGLDDGALSNKGLKPLTEWLLGYVIAGIVEG